MRLFYLRNVKFPNFSVEMLYLYLIFFAIAIFFILLGVTYEYLKKRYNYWNGMGISGPKPSFLIGNMKEFIFLKCTEPDMVDVWYKGYRSKPYIGFYNLLKPNLLIIDPELIKKVTEIDFNHFMDHPAFCGHSDIESIMDSLFTMKGEFWKMKRAIFSKMFTPKKLKEQFEMFNYRYSSLKKEIEEQSELGRDSELYKTMGDNVLTVVATILYGIDLTEDQQLFQDLMKYSEKFLHPSLFSTLMFVCYATSPDLFNFLRLKTFPRCFWDYFSPFTKQLLEYNKSSGNFKGGDLVFWINQYKDSESDTGIEHREAVGHIFSFLVASNHTTLTTINYGLVLLGQNPQAQDKLRDEVNRVMKRNKNITWDDIMNMNYLDAVLNETLRLYPLLGILKRVCTEEYHVDENLTIPKGMDVLIPVQALHMDPEYFEEPHKFRPERFLDLAKPPPVFMPFGKGPRICIGLRMAEVSFKVAVARIISDFVILPSPRTTLPVKKDKRSLFLTCMPENGLWVKFQKREVGH